MKSLYLTIILITANLYCVAREPQMMLHCLKIEEPISQSDITWIKEIGGNLVWLTPKNQDFGLINNSLETLSKAGLSAQSYVINPTNQKRTIRAWPTHRFLTSAPTKASELGVLTTNLLEEYGDSFSVERSEHYAAEKLWQVWDLSTSTSKPISNYDWSENQGVCIVNGLRPNRRYVISFVASHRSNSYDLVEPDAARYKTDILRDYITQTKGGVDCYRDTYLMYHFQNIEGASRKNNLIDWYGYGSSVNYRDIKRWRELYNEDFKGEALMNGASLRTTNDTPSDEYLALQKIMQANVMHFAKERNQVIRDSDSSSRVRFFWGDGWIGMEPYLGMLDEAGFDEIVTSVNDETDVRRVMSFEGSQRRYVRTWWRERGGVERSITEEREHYQNALRAILFACPDGYGVGGDLYQDIKGEHAESIKKLYREIFSEFRTIHKYTNGNKPYTNGLKLYVLNSWGKQNSWYRQFTTTPSQKLLRALTDLPIDVEFISFRDIADSGIPADADVILNFGEPGTAWSGDSDWNDSIASTISDFVARGGGFIGVDGTGVNHTLKRCYLEELLGLDFVGFSNRAAEQKIYTSSDAWRFHLPKRRLQTALTPLSAFVNGEELELGDVAHNCEFNITGSATQLNTKDCEALISENKFGKGLAFYISGIGDAANYQEFIKRVIYRASQIPNVAQKLDSPTAGAYIYYYPEQNILILYNHRATQNQMQIDCNEIGRNITLRPIYGASRQLTIDNYPFVVPINAGQMQIFSISR